PGVVGQLRGTGALERSPHCEPNHVILNQVSELDSPIESCNPPMRYFPYQGIMVNFYRPTYCPIVASVSLGSHTIVYYFRYN
ncbi:hypothetical protein EDD16DRAFT_1460722, partial [Pisolithus croceorrhizus]